jgi:hypothetical protein
MALESRRTRIAARSRCTGSSARRGEFRLARPAGRRWRRSGMEQKRGKKQAGKHAALSRSQHCIFEAGRSNISVSPRPQYQSGNPIPVQSPNALRSARSPQRPLSSSCHHSCGNGDTVPQPGRYGFESLPCFTCFLTRGWAVSFSTSCLSLVCLTPARRVDPWKLSGTIGSLRCSTRYFSMSFAS